MIKKISITVVLLTILLFGNTNCKKYLDVNKNIDAPASVDGYIYLAGIIQAYQGMYYDVRATSGLTQMMGTSSYPNFANHYYYEGSDAGGEQWRFIYWLQGMNLENMINQSVNNQDWTLAGIGLAIKAFSWDQLAKYHSELILKDAFVYGLMSHRYDYQDTVYAQVRRWAYKSIEYLSMTDKSYGTKISANDNIYKGDKPKWIKFAYGVIVSNLASLSNKTDFKTRYAPELISAANLSFQSSADDAVVTVSGKGLQDPQAAYNNFWGTFRGNLSRVYWQHEYAVQVFTGSIPRYDEATGNKIPAVPANTYYPNQLLAKQITADTITTIAGHFDPRTVLKLGTIDDATYLNMDVPLAITRRKYYGGSWSGTSGPIGSAPSFYGRNASSTYTGTVNDGKGRWLYRDDAPYVLMTCAQIKFDLAEAYWKLGDVANAFTAFKAGVYADLDFTGSYISPGTAGQAIGGDKISVATYNAIKAQYKAGPYVDGLLLADFSLSHIMMQKWIALYPWGANEAFVDMRKYHYDIKYTGDYPKSGNGWDLTSVTQKWDSDPTKVYKGFYLNPAQVSNRKTSFDTKNQGSPCYRIRPRYNSEYMWNKPSLAGLVPIAGTADNYQCSIPWFAYPGERPTSK